MFGQTGYWRNYARGDDTELRHGRERYGNETLRIYRVLDKRLAAAPFLAGSDYSVADMAVYPWIQPFMHLEEAQRDLADFPHVRQWYERIKARPAVQRAYELLAKDCKIGDRSDDTVWADWATPESTLRWIAFRGRQVIGEGEEPFSGPNQIDQARQRVRRTVEDL